ncbi:hypothetical protein ACQUQU_03715 [Thalassolituus sp. LLYu03]|uniref:hypothetical protein n=1 Tax=Thalassolituus sp. LLYu03 TaxID=3421656 RepID=UPI003D283243
MKLRYLWPLLLAPVISGCPQLGQHWDDQEETLYVDYYKVPCDTDSSDLCFRTRESESDSWAVSDAELTGFSSYSWGSRYTLTVTTSFDSNGDPTTYSFASVEAETAMADGSNAFALTLYSSSGVLVPLSDSEWQIGGDVTFDCSTSCTAIENAVDDQQVLQLEFEASGGTVTLSSFICSASEEDFDSECEGESTVSWYVAAFQSDCGLADAQMCLLFKVNSSDDYELLALTGDIEDFSPEWGLKYQIDVVRTVSSGGVITAAVLDADDSSPDDRTGSSYPFYTLVRGAELSENSDGTFAGYDSMPALDCSQYSLCTKLGDYVDDDQWLLLKAYVDDDLIITSIVCHDDVLSDFRECVDDVDDVNWNI